MARTMGSSKSATAPFHSESVRRVTCTPWRSKICSCRYNGRWSAYLELTTCANNPGPGRPFSMGRAGRAACTTPCWQRPQAYFGRTYSRITNDAGT